MSDLENAAGAADTAPEDDLRSALVSAVRESSAGEAGTDTPPAAKDGAAPVDKTAADRARDAAGKFASKPADKPAEGAKASEPAAAAPDGTAAAATRKAPASWSKDTQEAFATLPPAIQDQVLKREADVAKGFDERAAKVKVYDDLNTVLAPHAETFRRNGHSPIQGIQMLLQAQAALDQNPVEAIKHIAASYGIDLSGLSPNQAAQRPQPSQEAIRLARLEQHIQRQAEAEQQRQHQSVASSIEQFASNPANKHFAAVEGRMVALIQSGQAKGIEDAYEQATWLEPSIREQLLAERTGAAAGAASDQAAVQRAKQASSGVRGAPSGAVPAAPKPKGSLREELMAAVNAHRS